MAVSLYVVTLRSVGADGGPDGWGKMAAVVHVYVVICG